MALTEYDKKNLSSSDQQKIQAATDKWNAANAAGDTAGMAAAAAEAAAVRNQAGYKTDDSGNYTGSYSPTSTTKYYSTANGKTASTTSSGSSSTKNSQYSAPTLGDTWDANTDYQAIINDAVKNGDYVTAAKAEQLRNQKITGTGSNYNTTNMYTGYLDNTDYGTIGQQLMANNASWQDVLDIYNNRYNKASTTAGLEKYANDEIQQMMWNYIVDNMQQENQQEAQNQFNKWMEDYEQNNPKEDYESKYDPQIDALLNEILNRDDFYYNAMNDPLYQQYANMYQRQGDRAMKETLAEAAAGAGGMNTYAITAAQQANSYYNSQLNDKIPELYQLAYNMYLNDKESKVQDLGILQNMDATQYARYRDTINDYYADKNFAYGAYYDAMQQGNWQTSYNNNNLWNQKNFDNNNYWNQLNYDNNNYWAEKEFDNDNYWNEKNFDNSNYWNEKEFAANQDATDYNKEVYDRETAKEEAWNFIKLGVTPSADLIARAGMTEEEVNAAVASVKAQLGIYDYSSGYTYVSSGGSSGGSKSSGSNNSSKDKASNDKASSSGYNNGSLTDAQVRKLQEKVGVSVDGMWGAKSTEAAGGLSADAAWKKYFGDDEGDTWDATGNYQAINEACKSLLMTKGKSEVLAYLKRTLEEGAIPLTTYVIMKAMYCA